tara:strand:+ start:236 stop:514 length:279 start_codon:yes stop_codon:yes gene_type:complete
MVLPKKVLNKRFDQIGYVFIGLGIIIALPQLLQIYDTQSAEDINIYTWFGLLGSAIFWLIYGIERKVKPIAIGSVSKIILNVIVIYGIILYG